MTTLTVPLLLPFADGDATMADLLGGKGAHLAEMTRMGLPVPHGFTITTEACRSYLRAGTVPPELAAHVTLAVRRLEDECGRAFGAVDDPLLVSVRSGARFSMPGMMETVLNVGVTDATVEGLAARGGPHFAWDCYRRLVQMYGRTVLGVSASSFDDLLARARETAGVTDDGSLGVEALRQLVRDFRGILLTEAGEDLPQDPREQLDRAVEAVFASWNGARARSYRAHEGIPDDLGTAVNVVEMVFGNTGPRSGSGVCFTRDPASGAPGVYGDYLPNAQGEDVVNGSRTTLPIDALAEREPAAHAELVRTLALLEEHYRDLCDVEFTVEDGRLWMLQTRIGKRSPAAAFRIASDLADEGTITLDEALARVDGHQLDALLHPQFDTLSGHPVLAQGLPASPGASVGRVVFDSAQAVALRATGGAPVLLREETSPDDLDGMIAAEAVVTCRGGLTSHAAVVARGLGRTCVTSVAGLTIDTARRCAWTADGTAVREGDTLSVDGTSGALYAGALVVRTSPVAAALTVSSGADTTAAQEDRAVEDPLVRAVRRLLGHADRRRVLGVRANVETGPDAEAARALGAEGVGLCRTEHMLLGARRELVERVVVDHDRAVALAQIEDLARSEFRAVLRAMDGLPVVVRLLDPPLHEFLPSLVDLAAEAAVQESQGPVDDKLAERLATVRRWHEANPMLGLRGVRLLTVVPELVTVHVRALAAAADDLRAEGLTPRPEIMVPLVADPAELRLARDRIQTALDEVQGDRPVRAGAGVPDVPVGTMIELPRAALLAGQLAEQASFFSFGTNDLTQTTWGISRDDAEASFLTAYRTAGLLQDDPFTTLDRSGVGELIGIAVERGRGARPGLGLGACGEHAGDPESIHFLASLGLDYVSCSPPRVPIARLEAGRAEVLRRAGNVAHDTR